MLARRLTGLGLVLAAAALPVSGPGEATADEDTAWRVIELGSPGAHHHHHHHETLLYLEVHPR